jgi:hypothetical protein
VLDDESIVGLGRVPKELGYGNKTSSSDAGRCSTSERRMIHPLSSRLALTQAITALHRRKRYGCGALFISYNMGVAIGSEQCRATHQHAGERARWQ